MIQTSSRLRLLSSRHLGPSPIRTESARNMVSLYSSSSLPQLQRQTSGCFKLAATERSLLLCHPRNRLTFTTTSTSSRFLQSNNNCSNPSLFSSRAMASSSSSSSVSNAAAVDAAQLAEEMIIVTKDKVVQDKSSSTSSKDETQSQTKPIVGYMFLFTSSLVFAIVVVGGLTRLTESGLSITEWNLIKGMKPPRNESEWELEFSKYKQSPEFIKLNHRMTLEEFKFIYYMEWGHRMIGRFIGLTFILPAAYFARMGYMSKSVQRRSLLVAALIGGQGLLGWYMVKSGLDQELLDDPHAIPRVSQYRLTAHLGSAFVIYSIAFMTGLNIIRRGRVD